MKFVILSRDEIKPSSGTDTVYLRIDHWNDFSFVTMFYMTLFDEKGVHHEIGNVKIGFKGQTEDTPTYTKLGNGFDKPLSGKFFSLGESGEFYKRMALLPSSMRKNILSSLKDLVCLPEHIDSVRGEQVFSTSLLRSASVSIIKGQYARLLERKAELTDFHFKYIKTAEDKISGIELEFKVEADIEDEAKIKPPSTNIHALIGRNGVGKTTILNGMIEAITSPGNTLSEFVELSIFGESPIDKDYFSGLVSVSFSAFDPFVPPREQPDPAKGPRYFYIGLKDKSGKEALRTIPELHDDCVISLTNCFHDKDKTARWIKAIENLGSDDNFAAMRLLRLEEVFRKVKDSLSEQSDSEHFKKVYKESIRHFLSKMSSGHAIVLLTISRLVATVDEKTLVLLDEPESHLHPPLLSAFIRSLSDLCQEQNGVAIIATHSPVVLQEIPSSCIWKVNRIELDVSTTRPTIECFGENVGVLTKEVFGLEVVRSGFYNMLSKLVQEGRSYDDILKGYKNKLGFEGRSILKALITHRDGASK
ncbi:AAA family ATPase [Shewanella japonica]|uniref:AAA family ATPase n=1 Tax=Shewanella japonica TaxID=93973 RepID=UPI0024954734|nr:AAA family ATPase [Shewanella japonica]